METLKKSLQKIRALKKRTRIIAIIILLIVLAITLPLALKKPKQIYETLKVEKGNVIEEVSASGVVELVNKTDLRFRTGGIIQAITAKVGGNVKKGAVLARLDSGSIYSQYLQAQASYNQTKAKLNQFLAGATDGEIKVAEQVLENAKIVLDDARAKAENDLNQDYNSALVYLFDASSKCNKALADLKDTERKYFYYNNALDNTYRSKREAAEEYFQDAKNYVDIDVALRELKLSVQKFIDALDYAKTAMADPAVRENVSSTDKTTIDTDITNVNTAYSNINTGQADIANQKITNQVNINTAQATYNKAKVDLEKLEAAPRSVDIAVYQADVEKYQANMEEYAQKLRDMSIIAPFDGIVAKIDGKVGDIVSINDKIIVSLVSTGNLEIKIDISEADVKKANLDDVARVTLDAFPEEEFSGKIIEIESGETIVEGVVYYRAKILLDNPDNKIKSGMTADVTIETNRKENVLYVPQRAIVYKNGNKFVRIPDGKNYQEIPVITGLKGSNGEIEIVSGLVESQKIIVLLKK
jgi:RND family efflux transporter MFP subunit